MARISWSKFIPILLDNLNLQGRDREIVERYASIYQRKKTLSVGKKRHLKSIASNLERLESGEGNADLTILHGILNHPNASVVLSGWDTNFINSLISQVVRGRSLSTRQQTLRDGIKDKMTDEVIQENASAVSHFLNQVKSDFQGCRRALEWVSRYYVDIAPEYDYGFSEAVTRAIHSPQRFSKDDLNKIQNRMRQKYALRVVENMKKSPKFDVNTHVTFSSLGMSNRGGLSWGDRELISHDGGFVVAHHQKIADAVHGGNYCSVLIIGGGVVDVQERFLKKFPKNK